ncbi:MAG TPA: DUF4142 domain-containing protein [Steroidobacteraceae bacterium]|nr:DUF4142 domain-containing protein [Steroidobacteraceae bacterium]
MLTTLALLVLASGSVAQDQPKPDQSTPEQTTIPRQQDVQPYRNRDPAQGTPTDPLFDRKLVATDDPTFILNALEISRQSAFDARGAAKDFGAGPVHDTATAIATQSEDTTRKLEALAKRKGWRLPEDNPDRKTSLPAAGEARSRANFVVNQISSHEMTVAQFKAQIAGKGDADLKRTLKQALPGYEKNLQRLLTTKPD